MALEVKLQGNEFYKQQKYKEAVKCYLEAIGICPVEEKEEISKFHHNIAAVYTMMVSFGDEFNYCHYHYSVQCFYTHACEVVFIEMFTNSLDSI